MSTLHDKSYTVMGCHCTADGCVFRVWAPHAKAVSLVGDFNAWDGGAAPMSRDADGVWTAAVRDLSVGSIYKYAVTGADGKTVLKADPYAFHAETGPATGSKVWDLSGYVWHDDAWLQARSAADPRRAPMNIYELHLGSWRLAPGETYPNYRAVAPELADYCLEMGYTHVELLPVTEYPYEGSWGYQVTGYYAPTSRYGTPQDFMAFVDTLHKAGVGVIMDWVPAHFPKDEHGLRRFDGAPLFEYADPRLGEHPQWGTLVFNYASCDVRAFLTGSALFFLETYHIDGIRCDAVSSMLYLDYGRKSGQWLPNRDGGNINTDAADFLRDLNAAVAKAFPGAVTAAEESTAFPKVTWPAAEGGLGFTFKWDMGFMHDTLDYFALDPLFRSKNHTKLTFSMMYAFSEKFILAFSHDEVVHGKRSLLGKMFGSYEQKFAGLRAFYGYLFAHPGKKLTFMGGEFGQFIEWDYEKQLDWLLLDYPLHAAMQRYCAELGRLYRAFPALWEIEDSWDGFAWLNPDDADRSSVAFLRSPASEGDRLACVFNFTPVAWTDFVVGLPAPGSLTPLFDSDEARFGGGGAPFPTVGSEEKPFHEFGFSARLDLPPLSARYYVFREERHDKG
jgi:alpha-1,4-glucan:alpha-1,4-glucan 6-glycosyltransferase